MSVPRLWLVKLTEVLPALIPLDSRTSQSFPCQGNKFPTFPSQPDAFGPALFADHCHKSWAYHSFTSSKIVIQTAIGMTTKQRKDSSKTKRNAKRKQHKTHRSPTHNFGEVFSSTLAHFHAHTELKDRSIYKNTKFVIRSFYRSQHISFPFSLPPNLCPLSLSAGSRPNKRIEKDH